MLILVQDKVSFIVLENARSIEIAPYSYDIGTLHQENGFILADFFVIQAAYDSSCSRILGQYKTLDAASAVLLQLFQCKSDTFIMPPDEVTSDES
jgi:hypothetical protein